MTLTPIMLNESGTNTERSNQLPKEKLRAAKGIPIYVPITVLTGNKAPLVSTGQKLQTWHQKILRMIQ